MEEIDKLIKEFLLNKIKRPIIIQTYSIGYTLGYISIWYSYDNYTKDNLCFVSHVSDFNIFIRTKKIKKICSKLGML